MYSYLFSALGVCVLAFAILKAVQKRHNTGKCISSIVLGIFFTSFLMVLPTQWGKPAEEVFFKPSHDILSALLYSFKVLGGRQDIGQLETIALPTVLKGIYIGLNYGTFALAPILTSGLILSFFGNFGEKIQYAVRFFRHCHIFSELNENAIALAKGIAANEKGACLVFCNTKGANEALAEEAKKIGGVLLYSSCDKLRVVFRYKKHQYYLIGQEDRNINDAVTLIQKYQADRTHRITINAFAQNGANIKVVEALDQGRIELRFMDEIALFCNHLLHEHPLYEHAMLQEDGSRLISVLLIGGGRTGLQMLKTVVWAGQIEGYRLKIQVYDQKAPIIEEELYAMCPELKNYNIEFIKADVQHASFESIIQEKSADATYGVIAMGDDELNLIAADRIQGVLRRVKKFEKTPPLFVRVRAGMKAKNLSDTSYLEQRNITLFGTIDTIYSEKTLLNTELEKRALAVHLCYNKALDLSPEDPAYQKAVNRYLTSEYNRRSSMAAALHQDAKLHSAALLKEQGLESKEILDRLYRNEHLRWMAFMRSEGYRTTDSKTMTLYAPKTGRDRDDLSKLHPCIIDWDQLDALSAHFNQLGLSSEPVDFKEYDELIVNRIPKICEVAAALPSGGTYVYTETH